MTTIPTGCCLSVSVLVEAIVDVTKYHDQKQFVEEFSLFLSYTSISLFIFKESRSIGETKTGTQIEQEPGGKN